LRSPDAEGDPAPSSVRITSASLWGIEGQPVEIEVAEKRGHGPPRILGLPDAAIRESLHRIRTVFERCGLLFPRGQLIVNLAPASARKQGGGLDLPLALALGALSGLVTAARLRAIVAYSELALDGRLRPVAGCVAAAVMARQSGLSRFLCAEEDGVAASRVPGIEVAVARDLPEALLAADDPSRARSPGAAGIGGAEDGEPAPQLADVRGQESAKRALLAAAAGGHNLLLVGPPGCGKNFLVRRLPPLLPPLTSDQLIEVLKIHSSHGELDPRLFRGVPPFRAPHHTTSFAGLVGGGTWPRAGEITLAHHGVLFLDELPEFKREALESLRQPLEDGRIHIARARYTVSLPARFLLVAAMNPCPCGFLGHPQRPCICPPHQRRSYRSRISGPLLDRIDLQVELSPLTANELLVAETSSEPLTELRRRIAAARAQQFERGRDHGFTHNAAIPNGSLTRLVPLDRDSRAFLVQAIQQTGLSARAVGRIRRVARTLADLAGRAQVELPDIAEALQFRGLELTAGAE
jgi:magnesium chelatase family protein